MHLLTAHIDALTAKVSAPLDRLVEVALQASRTSGMAKQHLLDKFEKRANFIIDQLQEVDTFPYSRQWTTCLFTLERWTTVLMRPQLQWSRERQRWTV